MGCCYSTPVLDDTVTDKGQDLDSLVAWRFPDSCKQSWSLTPPKPASHAQQAATACGSSSGPTSGSHGQPAATGAERSSPHVALVQPPQPLAGAFHPAHSALRPPLMALAGGIAVSPRHLQVSPDIVRLQYRELTPEDYELLCLLDEVIPKKDTAPQCLVSRLPCLLAMESGATQCQVCLCDLQPHTRVSRLPCQHVFHPDCISKWLTQCNGTCPLCLSSVKSTSLDLPAEESVGLHSASIPLRALGRSPQSPTHSLLPAHRDERRQHPTIGAAGAAGVDGPPVSSIAQGTASAL